MRAPASSKLTLGYSTCPNDTFVFHALVSSLVPCEGVKWTVVMRDIEELNRLARDRELDVTKVSFPVYGAIRDEYAMLDSGAALGRGCGPLLVARDAAVGHQLDRARVAIPGHNTSATLLLRLFAPRLNDDQLVAMRFDQIMPACCRGDVDAGLIIHESRFTYARMGLVALADLGDWWEAETGHPIPLAGILARKSLGAETIRRIESALAASVRYARAHPDASAAYVREHAHELSEEVTRAHIELYVNEFSESLGDAGRAAAEAFLTRGDARGVLPS